MRDPLRVVLADDQVLFRQAVAALLNARPGIEVVGEASDGLEAIAVARATLPDVILMDIHMPNCGGLEAVRVIAGEMPHVQIVMLAISEPTPTSGPVLAPSPIRVMATRASPLPRQRYFFRVPQIARSGDDGRCSSMYTNSRRWPSVFGMGSRRRPRASQDNGACKPPESLSELHCSQVVDY